MTSSKIRRLLYSTADTVSAFIRPVTKRVLMGLATDIRLERQRRALATTVDFIEKHMRDVKPVDSKYELLTLALQQANVSGDQLLCEFGVFQGSTINHVAGLTSLPPKQFLGLILLRACPKRGTRVLPGGILPSPGCRKSAATSN